MDPQFKSVDVDLDSWEAVSAGFAVLQPAALPKGFRLDGLRYSRVAVAGASTGAPDDAVQVRYKSDDGRWFIFLQGWLAVSPPAAESIPATAPHGQVELSAGVVGKWLAAAPADGEPLTATSAWVADRLRLYWDRGQEWGALAGQAGAPVIGYEVSGTMTLDEAVEFARGVLQ